VLPPPNKNLGRWGPFLTVIGEVGAGRSSFESEALPRFDADDDDIEPLEDLLARRAGLAAIAAAFKGLATSLPISIDVFCNASKQAGRQSFRKTIRTSMRL